MKIAILYVGSSLLAPLRRAERDINERYRLDLRIAAHNCTLPLAEEEWPHVERDLGEAEIVFVLHVTDSENAARIGVALDRHRDRHRGVVVINCLGALMRRTRLGAVEPFSLMDAGRNALAGRLLRIAGSWMSGYTRARRHARTRPEHYLKLVTKLPGIVRFVPSSGALGGIKHYLTLFCYFLQPTPANIRSMLLHAIKFYVPGYEDKIKTERPESRPAMGIYHPEAPALFESFDAYRRWYEREKGPLDPRQAIGLLLMRPQIISGAHGHYDELIRAIEREGLPVVPVLSTLMDNRDACREFLVAPDGTLRASQMLSLTGFSFVGGPAMNDSEAAVAYLKSLNRPLRSAVSLETQRIEDWNGSMIGLNPVQTAMQVAIPEIDGATESFVYGGLSAGEDQPEALRERCGRIARRLVRWNRLQRLPREKVRLAFLIYCFPPNKGNLGTAADLDVFPSLWDVLGRLRAEGYSIELPESADALRERLLDEPAYRLPADQYFRLCDYVEEIESDWGPPPGRINSQGRDILIQCIQLGNALVAIQPTFGYEGDPMRMLMAKSGSPHHGFMGLYVYLEKIFCADALIHVGTHGALEFMPGKQVGLSDRCWPDRLIGSFPNVYIYSVNNPSEGSIAKRRSYAELISYLTPPIEDAGLYKELLSLKDLLLAYRQSRDEKQRDQLFEAIGDKAEFLKFT